MPKSYDEKMKGTFYTVLSMNARISAPQKPAFICHDGGFNKRIIINVHPNNTEMVERCKIPV